MSTSPNSRRGFSLIEVIIALAVLALVSGSVFAVLRGTLDVTAGLRENQSRQDQIDGFLDLCRTSFRLLPGQADLELRIRQQEGKSFPEVIFRNAPGLFAWGTSPDLQAISVLSLKPGLGGRFSLSLLRIHPGNDFSGDPVASAQPGDWLVLIPEIQAMSWRFYNRQSNEWKDILPQGAPRPSAAELILSLADQPEPIRAVFQINPLIRMPANGLLPPPGTQL